MPCPGRQKGTSEAVQKARSKNAASIAYILYGIIKWQRRCAIQLAKAGAAAQELLRSSFLRAWRRAAGISCCRSCSCSCSCSCHAASASRARRALAVLLLLLELVVLVVPAVVPCCPRCQRCAAEVLVALVVLLLLVYFCLRACPPAGRAAQGEPTRDGGHVREQNCALTCSTCLFA